MFHGKLVDALIYKQMAGRAGRKGVDALGESVLMCKPAERQKAASLLNSRLKAVQSCLLGKNAILLLSFIAFPLTTVDFSPMAFLLEWTFWNVDDLFEHPKTILFFCTTGKIYNNVKLHPAVIAINVLYDDLSTEASVFRENGLSLFVISCAAFSVAKPAPNAADIAFELDQ